MKAKYPPAKAEGGATLPWDIEFGFERGALRLFQDPAPGALSGAEHAGRVEPSGGALAGAGSGEAVRQAAVMKTVARAPSLPRPDLRGAWFSYAREPRVTRATRRHHPIRLSARRRRETKIRRLTGFQLAHEGKLKSTLKLPPGALLGTADVILRLKDTNPGFDLTAATPKDPQLQAGLEKIFASRDPSYNIAMLDISDPHQPRYAAVRADKQYIPGSVAKLFVATGVFGALQKAYPDDFPRGNASCATPS